MKIVFMGTPDFAVASLAALIHSVHEVVAVVTAVDKLGGRGHQSVMQSAVKKVALENNILCLQPEKLRNENFIDTLRSLKADAFVVVAFRMLPEVVWSLPPLGTINIHGSLLPAYRGAAPINWAIINGESKTGVTSFLIRKDIDTGPILLQTEVEIGSDENFGEVYDKMKNAGSILLIETLEMIEKGSIEGLVQDNIMVSYAPKIFHGDCALDLTKPAWTVHNLIRGLSPAPGAWIMFNEKSYKILQSRLCDEDANPQTHNSGFWTLKNKLYLKCSDRFLEVVLLQAEGKRKMLATEFVNGLSNG